MVALLFSYCFFAIINLLVIAFLYVLMRKSGGDSTWGIYHWVGSVTIVLLSLLGTLFLIWMGVMAGAITYKRLRDEVSGSKK